MWIETMDNNTPEENEKEKDVESNESQEDRERNIEANETFDDATVEQAMESFENISETLEDTKQTFEELRNSITEDIDETYDEKAYDAYKVYERWNEEDKQELEHALAGWEYWEVPEILAENRHRID